MKVSGFYCALLTNFLGWPTLWRKQKKISFWRPHGIHARPLDDVLLLKGLFHLLVLLVVSSEHVCLCIPDSSFAHLFCFLSSHESEFWTREIIVYCHVLEELSFAHKREVINSSFQLEEHVMLAKYNEQKERKLVMGFFHQEVTTVCKNGRLFLVINGGKPSWLKCVLVHRRRGLFRWALFPWVYFVRFNYNRII